MGLFACRGAWFVVAAGAGAAATLLCGRALAQEHAPLDGHQTLARTDKEVRCDRFDTSALAIRVDETACLKRLGDVASRQGDQLRLKLRNGKGRTLASPQGCAGSNVEVKCKLYQLAGFFPTYQMILVHVQLYEGDVWLLINQQSGSQITLPGPPHFSPSGSRVVSINWDESELTVSGIDIWSLKTDPPTLEWRNRHEAVEFDRWLSDERFVVKMFYGKWPVEITRTSSKWDMLQPHIPLPRKRNE
jgi:hypothetical protein